MEIDRFKYESSLMFRRIGEELTNVEASLRNIFFNIESSDDYSEFGAEIDQVIVSVRNCKRSLLMLEELTLNL